LSLGRLKLPPRRAVSGDDPARRLGEVESATAHADLLTRLNLVAKAGTAETVPALRYNSTSPKALSRLRL
jgi:hypothetical protein